VTRLALPLLALPPIALVALVALVATAALLAGCGEPEPPAPFKIELKVTSDPGKPLPGAEIVHSGEAVANTGPAGIALLTLRGAEGESYDLFVRCPAEYQSPAKPITVFLRRIGEATKHARYEAACPPALRTVVVAVRAENGPNLPVLYLGQPVARTDPSGAATVLLRLKPGEQFDLTLATADKDAELLRPQNPSWTFLVKPHDDVMLFDQRFTVDRRPPKVGVSRDTRPVRL
jgi:hypothetical protein